MNIFKEVIKLQEANIPFALTTIIETKGSTPRSHAKMIVLANGEIIGTIGGGPIEDYIKDQAKEAINQGRSRTINSTLRPGNSNKTNMECGGDITVFIEVINRNPKLILIGAGHVNQAVSRAAESLDFFIEVVDNRKELLTDERFPMAKRLHFDKVLSTAIQNVKIDKNSYILIATNHDDKTSLHEVIDSNAAYIGMLGSKRKLYSITEDLKGRGVSEDKISSIYSPVGLDIGAETPEEIAFSVLAEILMIKNSKSGKPLKDIK